MNKSIMPALLTTIVVLFAACSQSGGVDQERTNNGSRSSPAAAPTVMTEGGFVYTADEQGNSVTVIDLSTRQIKDIALPISPHNVQVSHDGRLLLVVGSVAAMTANQSPMKEPDAAKMARGRLLIIDAETLAVGSAADIEIGRHPAHVIIDAQGKLAYATNSEDNNVLVIDVAQKKAVGEIKTGNFPHGLRMSPDGREIYVANVNDNSVSVIDIAQSKEVTRIPVGKAPVQVGFTPDGRRVYVSLRDENSVAVIDTAQRKKVAAVAVGRNPIQVFSTPDGHYVYVANQGTETNSDNTVSVIDTTNNSVVATIETGKGAHGVVVSDDGRRAFITNIMDDTVSVIDTATQKVINRIKVGKGPNGITFAAKTDLVQAGQGSSTAAANKVDPLAGGAEIFENLTEASPLIEEAAFKKSLAEFERLYPSISAHLSPDQKKRLDSLVAGVRNAWQRGDRGAMAVQSIEVYRLLEESINRRGQPVPVEVPMLDYAGFKLKALLLSSQLDWKQAGKTAQEASGWWAAIEAHITDKSLGVAMAHTIAGLKEAADREDSRLLRFAAEMDLILVDGLELFFNSHASTQ
ncbi:MAG: YncE family protein [Candidatus Manganitrophaceae bacterium]